MYNNFHRRNYGKYHDFKCANGDCEYKYWNWEEHQSHCDTEHGGLMLFRCGICPEAFASMILVNSHRAAAHKGHTMKGDNVTVCIHCGRNMHKNYLKAHVLRFHGNESLTCDDPDCGKTFNSSVLLKEHKRLHKQNYTCDECG